MSSILDDVKHSLGLLPDDTAWDPTVIMHINTAFSTLTQVNIGPPVGFQIVDRTKQWVDYYTDPRLNAVQSYIYLKVRSLFDPPKTGFETAAMERQLEEHLIRLNLVADYG